MLDKTGTITAGKPALTGVRPAGRWDAGELLALVAAAESDSEHPLAAAIVAGAAGRSVHVPRATGFESVTGQGVRATVNGHLVPGRPAGLTPSRGSRPSVAAPLRPRQLPSRLPTRCAT